MSDEKLRQLLSILPDDGEIAAGAARSRRKALARLNGEARPVRRKLWWAPAVAVVAVVLTIVGAVRILTMPPASPEAVVAPEPLRMHWVLSDGTKVHWTFHRNL